METEVTAEEMIAEFNEIIVEEFGYFKAVSIKCAIKECDRIIKLCDEIFKKGEGYEVLWKEKHYKEVKQILESKL